MRLSLIPLAASLALAKAEVAEPYEDCDVNTYYASLAGDASTWDREDVHQLLLDTHRNVVQFTNSIDPGIDDAWGAIIDVDAGNEPGTVKLVYSEDEIAAIPFSSRDWVREHLFPVLRGVGVAGPDLTDVHNLRPSDPISHEIRDTKYFGECGVLVRPETCMSPAEGGAGDTCSCNRVYTPPASVRGDIARALMYMDLRYDGTELLTRDLRLTDCPFQPERDMAYLSQMIQWHREDPPDAREIARNNKVCANWQGNRNPFVDFPELATTLWNEPLPLPAIGERLIYEQCEAIPTLPPTFAANQCDLYDEGDFAIWLLNSDKPVVLGMYNFPEMPEGFELFITDNPWNGEKFLEQEGTLKFTTPEGGFRGGTLFGYGQEDFPHVNQFSETQGDFSPSLSGDAIFVYCIDSAGEQRPLTVFNNGGVLADAGLDVYEEGESALPADFPEEGIINLVHFDNLLYVGGGDMDVEDLKIAVRDPDNWEGSNDQRYGLPGSGSAIGRSWTLAAGAVVALVIGAVM